MLMAILAIAIYYGFGMLVCGVIVLHQKYKGALVKKW